MRSIRGLLRFVWPLAIAVSGCGAPEAPGASGTDETPASPVHYRSDLSYKTHIFYYGWYGNPRTDGSYKHWNHRVLTRDGTRAQFSGGDSIGANYYPARGTYSSKDPATIDAHLDDLEKARVGVVVYSWWGQGDDSDQALAVFLDRAVERQIYVAIHLEPFPGRNAATARAALEHLVGRYGQHPGLFRDPRFGDRPIVYVYDSYLTPAAEWATLLSPDGAATIRGTELDAVVLGLWVKESDGRLIDEAGFDGFYTYFAADGFTYGATVDNWQKLAEWGWHHRKIFVPSIGPGYVDTRIRPWNGSTTRDRGGGRYFDRAFRSAVATRPEILSITSYNEWHEGTQIEPAQPKRDGSFEYEDYGDLGPEGYLDRTAQWVRRFDRPRSEGSGSRR